MDKLREIIKGTMVYSTNKARAGLFDYDQLNEQADMLTSAITKLFKERMLELIGSDEVCETHDNDNLELDEYIEPCYIKIRNNLRAELRKKVGER
jgi:hypothetical protein